MTEILKVKIDDKEVYPRTHANAVENLGAFVDEKVSSAGAGTVKSVNGKTGVVTLVASDVGALPNTTQIPTIPGVATTTASGLMASADKVKLNGVEAGAQKNPTAATQTTAGLMSATDKTKLDNLPKITFEKVGEV